MICAVITRAFDMNITINPKLLFSALLIASLALAALSCRATKTPDAVDATTDGANNPASSDAATPLREEATDIAALRGSADLIGCCR